MNFPNDDGSFYNRRYIIYKVFSRVVESLKEFDINAIDKTIEDLIQVFEEGIVQKQVLYTFEIILSGSPSGKLGYIVGRIDWNKHEMHIKMGDEFITLPISSGRDPDLKDISLSLHHLSDTIKGTQRYLKWNKCQWVVTWRSDVSRTTLDLARSKMNLGPPVSPTSDVWQKREILRSGVGSVTPSKIDEVRLTFAISDSDIHSGPRPQAEISLEKAHLNLLTSAWKRAVDFVNRLRVGR